MFSEYHAFTEMIEERPTQKARAFLASQFCPSCFYWKVVFQILSLDFWESILEATN